MSSATSIDRAAERAGQTPEPRTADAVRQDGFKPAHFFVLLSLLGATVAVVIAKQPARVVEVTLDWPPPRDIDTVADLDLIAAEMEHAAAPAAEATPTRSAPNTRSRS